MDFTSDRFHKFSDEKQAEITKRIIHLRKNIMKMTQKQFSIATEISQSYLSQLESDKKPLFANYILQIKNKLNVSTDWLLEGGDDSKIFMDSDNTPDSLKKNIQVEAFDAFIQAFSLKDTEVDFIKWYLRLNSLERHNLHNVITMTQNFKTLH